MPRRRRHLFLFVAALSLPLMASHDARVSPNTQVAVHGSDGRALSAREFVARIGVNAHVSWPNHAPYSDTARVIAAMEHLGIVNLRDHINSSTFPVFERLAASGLRFNLVLNPVVGVDHYIRWASRLARTYPGSVVALEGPNEVDKWPVSYEGMSGFAAAVAVQKALHAKARADPALARTPIYNVTVAGISRSNSEALGDLSAYADYGNVHPYYRAGQQSWGHSLVDDRYTLKNYIASARWTAPGRAVVITETGSTTSPGSPIGVTEEVQAKQILNSLLASAKHGVAATYIYELADSHDNGPQDIESHYGLFRHDWTPKPAARALHNLTRILGGPRRDRAAARRAPVSPPAFTLAGLPRNASSLVLQEDDGTFDIVIWAEPDLWQDTTKRPIPAPAATVKVAFGSSYPRVAIYDPLISDRPLRTFGPATGVSVSLTDHPLIVELAPSAAPLGREATR